MILKSMARIGMLLVAALMIVGAFAAVTLIGIGTNPPPLRIAVATRDIQVGERLKPSDYRVVEQILDPLLASLYIQGDEVATYEGAFVVDVFRKGDPLNKKKLSSDKSGLSGSRYALVLDDPNEVIMTLPANPDIIPGKLAPGDYINILFSSGSEGGISALPDSKLRSTLPDMPQPVPGNVSGQMDTGLNGVLSDTKPQQEIVLPLADLMLEHVTVLDINYQQIQNPNYGSDGGADAPAFVNGPITSIVVKVPRSHQTLLTFGISTSRLRYAIASPRMEAKQLKPELSMDWAAYMAAYRWKQEQVAARGETLTQTLYPDFVASVMTQTIVQPAGQPQTLQVVPVATPTQ